jgi:cytochrome c553
VSIDYMDIDYKGESFKSVVTDWNYADLNVTCERCHGPASEHVSDKTKLIMPQYLTVEAAAETCGQCHGNHDGRSQVPEGIFKPAYDGRYKDALGNGFFVPGLYSLDTFFFKFDIPMALEPGVVKPDGETGSFFAWPDQTHARVHSQEYLELRRSKHYNNPYQKLVCFDCHNAHTLDGGPSSLVVDGYDFESATYGNNTLCLTCHAAQGPFANVSTADVAVLQLDAGRTVTKDGETVVVSAIDAALARNRVAKAVAEHMQTEAAMGVSLYTPDDPDMPVGSCTSCHMAKIGKLQDLNVDFFYRLDFDEFGNSAVAEGDVPSHVFDIVWPGQSATLLPSATHDYDIMPNSCSKCHDAARISGDAD